MSPILEGVKNSSGAAMGISGGKFSRAFLSQITHSELESAFSGEDIRVISWSGLPENVVLSFSAISASFIDSSSFVVYKCQVPLMPILSSPLL